MTVFRVLWPALLLLSACAQLPISRSAPVCDGHHRRLANPHGSVLTPTAVSPAATVASPAAETPGGFASCP